MGDNKVSNNKNIRVHFRENVIFQRFEEKAILVNLGSEEIYELNETGTQIAELIYQDLTLEEVLNYLEDRYGTDSSNLESDVLALLKNLSEKQLLLISSPGQKEKTAKPDG